MKKLEAFKECIFVAESGNENILIINRAGLCVSTLDPEQFNALVSAGVLTRSRVIDTAIVYRIAS
jgi:hypothetical protein